MRKATSILLVLIMLLVMLPTTIFANEPIHNIAASNLILRVDNQQIYNNNFTNLNDKVDALKLLDEGTIIIRFRPTATPIMSLFSLSNNTTANGHFHLYVTPSAIGSENRYEKTGEISTNTQFKVDVPLKTNEVHTLAMVVDKTQGYKYFLDGKLVKQDTTTVRKFLSNIYAPNSAQIGRTERKSGSNNYPFSGEVDFAEVYGSILTDQELIAITGVTQAVPVQNPLPDSAMITDPHSVFYPGLYGSSAYRIPALLYTKAGTLISGIDKRINGGGDSPANIDIIVKRSLNQGDTWENNEVLINNYPGNASNIDQALLQDQDTDRIYSLVLGFPEGAGFPTAQKGSGFKSINGKPYLILWDSSNAEYTVRENGEVYNHLNVKTSYTVDKQRDLYNNNVKVSHIFLDNSPLKPLKTSYLEMWHSDDDGVTWDGPVDLNSGIKEEWMAFLGAGPGSGIQLTQGVHKGRLVFPIYFTNEMNSQASAVIYSDDHGVTWHRGESPNEGRIVNGVTLQERTFRGNEITEAQVLEMPDGQLKIFMRNYSGFAQIATSFDGGATWDSEVVTESGLIAAYCQMTAIRYNGLIDGKEAVIFASPGNSSSRINGTVKAGLILEEGTYSNGRTKYKFDWKYSQLVKEGHYAYSSLANLANGDIGLLYEGTGSAEMSFIKFDVDYLKWQKNVNSPPANLKTIAIETPNPNGYLANDPLKIKVVFDRYMMLSGDRNLKGTIGDQPIEFQYVSQNEAGTDFIFQGNFPTIAPGSYPLVAGFDTNLKAYNAFGNALPTQAVENKLQTDVISRSNATEQGEATQLTGASRVDSGEEFNIQLGLNRINQPSYAQDITVNYNPVVMDFVSMRSLISGVNPFETITTTSGTIRTLLASTGAEHGVTGDVSLLELSFKAKDVTEAKSGIIQVSKAEIGFADGTEATATASTLSVEVEPVVIGIPGDINMDGKVSIGDLGIVAAHYGKDVNSSDWEQVKKADVNKDGKIDIVDLTSVARLIVN
ncbi:sialidase domain-containing protein [Paenibacillus sp. CMAA1364]